MIMNKRKVIENFMSTLEIDSVCGYSILEDDLGLQIILIFDREVVNNTKPGFIVSRTKSYVQSELKKWLGIENIYIGSSIQNCKKLNSN